MRVLVVGTRTFDDYDFMVNKMRAIEAMFYRDVREPNIVIISGGARGADRIAMKYAECLGVEKVEFPADWKKHGKKAGPIRNTAMVKDADVVVAFWDGHSRGTHDTIVKAAKAKKPVFIFWPPAKKDEP